MLERLFLNLWRHKLDSKQLNIHIDQYLKKERQLGNEIWSVNKKKLFFLKNHTQNMVEKLFPDPFLKKQNWA